MPCTSASTLASTASRMPIARSISAASMVNGGSIRTTFSAVRLTSRPRSRAPSMTGVASIAQLEAAHQTGAANLHDHRVLQRERAQLALEVRADASARARAAP